MTEADPRPGLLPVSPWAIGSFLLGSLVVYAMLLRRPSLVITAWIVTTGVLVLISTTRQRKQKNASPRRKEPRAAVLSGTVTQSYPLVLTADEAAEILRIRTELIVEAIRTNRLPGNHIDHHWRVRTEALMAWLDGSFANRSDTP